MNELLSTRNVVTDRREAEQTPVLERRTAAERRSEPRWLTWTRQNESRGKSLDGRAA